jgi:hypothetical protein
LSVRKFDSSSADAALIEAMHTRLNTENRRVRLKGRDPRMGNQPAASTAVALTATHEG